MPRKCKVRSLKVLWAGAIVGAAVGLQSSASAATIMADYEFTGGSATSSDADPNTTASSAFFGAFTGGSYNTTNCNFSSSTNNAFIRSSTSGDTTEAAAVSNDDSLGFTVTPNAGATMSITSLAFSYGSSSDGTNSFTSNFVVRSSVDNYGADLGTGTYSYSNTSTNPAFNSTTIDLSTNSAFQNLTGPVTFKFFEFDNSTQSGQIARLDGITLNGSSTPEPASAGLLGLAAVGLLARRKPRH